MQGQTDTAQTSGSAATAGVAPAVAAWPDAVGTAAALAAALGAAPPAVADGAPALPAGEGRLVVVWTGLADRLAGAGDAPSAALAGWAAAATALLALFRANRRRLILIEAAPLARGETAAALAARLGRAVELPPTVAGGDALAAVLAALALARDPALARLAAELVAASLPAGDGASLASLMDTAARDASARDTALAAERGAHAAAASRAETLAAEAAGLRTALEVETAALAAATGRADDLSYARDAERAARIVDAEAAAEDRAKRDAEVDLLRSQVTLLQAEVEAQVAAVAWADRSAALTAARAEARTAAEVRADLARQVATLQARIETHQALEADLRAARQAAALTAKEAAAGLDEIARLARSLAEAERAAATRAAEAATLAEARAAAEAAATDARTAAEAAEAERARVYASTSWKVTEPLRRLRRMFS